jgi:hypothetical protein
MGWCSTKKESVCTTLDLRGHDIVATFKKQLCFSYDTIELSVMRYPVCFPLLSPPHAIVILYLYCVFTPLQPLYS